MDFHLDLSLYTFLCALFHCWLLPLLFYSKPTNPVFVAMTNFITEPLWQCVLSHTFLLPNLFCWNELSVQLLLQADVPLDSSSNHYSPQSSFIHAPSTFLACCWSGRVTQQGTSVSLEISFCHMNSFKRHPPDWQFLKSPSVGCSCRCASLCGNTQCHSECTEDFVFKVIIS